MPKRLTKEEAEAQINAYGYFFTPKTVYKNSRTAMNLYDAEQNKNVNLSLDQINYRVRRGYRGKYDIFNILNEPDVQQPQPHTGYDRFCNKLRDYKIFNTLDDNKKQQAYTEYQNMCRRLGTKRNFDVDFTNGNLPNDLMIFVIIQAFKAVKKRMNKRIQLKVKYDDDSYHYFALSYDTINYFESLLLDLTPQEVSDSISDMFETYNNWSSMEVVFKDSIKAGGFFPYINKLSNFDLSQYGVYNEINYDNYKNNCLIDALVNSSKFNNEQLNLIKSSIYIRVISLDYIQKICDLMNCNITIRIPEEDTNKTNAKVYKSKQTSEKNIVIFLYNDHFMINNEFYCQEYYIANHKTLDKKYPNDITRYDIINDNGDKRHSKMTIVRLIKCLRKYNLLEPIPEAEQQIIAKQYNHFEYKPKELIDDYFRKITIKNKNNNQCDYLNSIFNNDGYFMFGEHITDKNKLNSLYNNLQSIIDTLNIKVRVRNYNKFAELMNKIMYEYGCFENVYEIAEPLSTVIRNQLVFPKPHTTDGNKFYSNKKLYYIDLNSAYLSVIQGIPTGKCDIKGNFNGELNTKIKELIDKLYTIRQSLKETNPTLSKCIKLMTTSCWGSSIAKHRLFKTIKTKNIDSILNKNINTVIEYDDSVVRLIKSISFKYSYPQFAREVLNNYHEKINKIRSLCNIFYENIDAILINEDDYKKLENNGFIGNELGKFKIEHIFKEIAISSSRKFVGILDNDEKFIHLPKKDIDYDEFVDEIKNNKFTTIY